jgi:RNA polymerase sigma-70 factor (ECF subfamily)
MAQTAVDGSPISDDELVDRARKGDSAAFDGLVERHKERVYATIYHMTSNRDDADDLTQETFIRAYRAIRKFRGKSSFYTWIYRIAVNLTVNFLKRSKRNRELDLHDMDEGVSRDPDYLRLVGAAPTPRQQVSRREFQEKLTEALQHLTEAHRMVVTLHDIQGMPHGEIARIMGCSEGTVRSRLYYARQQLQGLLSEFAS